MAEFSDNLKKELEHLKQLVFPDKPNAKIEFTWQEDEPTTVYNLLRCIPQIWIGIDVLKQLGEEDTLIIEACPQAYVCYKQAAITKEKTKISDCLGMVSGPSAALEDLVTHQLEEKRLTQRVRDLGEGLCSAI